MSDIVGFIIRGYGPRSGQVTRRKKLCISKTPQIGAALRRSRVSGARCVHCHELLVAEAAA